MSIIIINAVGERKAKPDHLEYYYDKHTKLWVVKVIAEDGYEYADGDYEFRVHTYPGYAKDSVIKEWCNEYGVKALKITL